MPYEDELQQQDMQKRNAQRMQQFGGVTPMNFNPQSQGANGFAPSMPPELPPHMQQQQMRRLGPPMGAPPMGGMSLGPPSGMPPQAQGPQMAPPMQQQARPPMGLPGNGPPMGMPPPSMGTPGMGARPNIGGYRGARAGGMTPPGGPPTGMPPQSMGQRMGGMAQQGMGLANNINEMRKKKPMGQV
jgi:hypothetical protein